MDQQHRPVIEQLIPVYTEPDFDEILFNLTAKESASTRFLIKMELNRLMKACHRGIDLRSLGEPACQRVELDGRIHYLTPEAITLYHHLVQYYGGNYSIGVYENVKAAARASQRAADDPEKQPLQVRFNANEILFGDDIARRESRLQLLLPVQLFTGGEPLAAQTSDLSLHGLRIRPPMDCVVAPGQQLELQFSEIAQPQFADLARARLRYQVIAIERSPRQQWLRLKAHKPQHPQWSDYLKHVANSLRGRRRLNVDNVLEQVRIKGYEQYFLSRLSGLPLFFNHPTAPCLSHLLLNENNQPLLDYWRDTQQQPLLAGLLNAPGIRLSLPPGSDEVEQLIYSFSIESAGNIQHYLASDTMLAKTGLKRLFTAFGAHRGSWRVFRLVLQPISAAQSQALQPCWQSLSLDSASRQQLSRLCAIGILYDLTTEENTGSYQSQSLPDSDLNVLKQFILPPSELPVPTVARLQYMQLRRESRFSYRSAVTLFHGGQSVAGRTRDFSVNGLCLELDHPQPVAPGAEVAVSLDQLQALSPKYRLQRLPYRVVGKQAQRAVLHLQADSAAGHPGSDFFRRLIQANQSKLSVNAGRESIPGLALALRNIFLRHSFGTPLYVHYRQNQLQLDTLARTASPGRLASLLQAYAEPGRWSLYPLLHNKLAEKQIFSRLRRLKREDRPAMVEIYLQLQQGYSGGQPPLVSFRLSSEFFSEQERRRFVSQAHQHGRFYSFQAILSRAGELDMQFIAKEMELISQHAMHRARAVADELEQVVGVVDLVDTTRETLFRLDLHG